MAELAADGQTNRDIAQALFVTPKTVEVHLEQRLPQARHPLAPRARRRARDGLRRWPAVDEQLAPRPVLHVLAMAFFVGGQIVVAAAVVPVERHAPDRERLRAIARRFAYGTLVAVAVLVATGSALAGHEHVWGSGTLHLKLALVGVVALLLVWHVLRPTMHAIEAAVFLVSLVIVWLGLKLAPGA